MAKLRLGIALIVLLALAGCRKRVETMTIRIERGAFTGDYTISTSRGICAYGPELKAALERCRKVSK